jgi:hypothetical protein
MACPWHRLHARFFANRAPVVGAHPFRIRIDLRIAASLSCKSERTLLSEKKSGLVVSIA